MVILFLLFLLHNSVIATKLGQNCQLKEFFGIFYSSRNNFVGYKSLEIHKTLCSDVENVTSTIWENGKHYRVLLLYFIFSLALEKALK